MPLALSEKGRTRPGHGSIRRCPVSQPPKAVSEHQRHPVGDHQVVFAQIPRVNIGIRDRAEADAGPVTVVKGIGGGQGKAQFEGTAQVFVRSAASPPGAGPPVPAAIGQRRRLGHDTQRAAGGRQGLGSIEVRAAARPGWQPNQSFAPEALRRPKPFAAASDQGVAPAIKPGRLTHTCGQVTYLMIFATTPAPTVRPPSRMAKRRPSSMAIGWISSTSIDTLSPGITISTPSFSFTVPVTSVVRK